MKANKHNQSIQRPKVNLRTSALRGKGRKKNRPVERVKGRLKWNVCENKLGR